MFNDMLNTKISLMDLPNEIITHIFLELPIETIYKVLILLDKNTYSLVNDDYFIKLLLNREYPKFANLMLCSSTKENFKMIYRCIDKIIEPKHLPYKVHGSEYIDKTLVLPYNIIATLLNLPKLEIMYTEIIGYLRCTEFEFKKLKNFPEKPDYYRITIFTILSNATLFQNCSSREKLNMSFEELFKKIVPINLKDTEHFKNTDNMYAITIQTNKDGGKEIFYSGLNSDRAMVQKLFQEVTADYKSKYA
jgi:hypothetical protein